MPERSHSRRETNPAERAQERAEPDQGQVGGHRATPVQLEAQRLLEEAGSPDLAKHATVPGNSEGSPQDQFARKLGFASYLSLFEDSARLRTEPHKQWFVTALRNHEWILWNDSDLVVMGPFETKEAAEGAAAKGGAAP
jgi:hypothetical protein